MSACGTGKTYTALIAAEKMVAEQGVRTILVQVPSLGLVNQIVKDWSRDQQWGANFRFMAVCSAKDIQDDDGMRPSDLSFPISSTGKDDIVNFLGHEIENDDLVKVVFSTYQSSDAVEAATADLKVQFDLGIADEAHRTVQSRTKRADDGSVAAEGSMFTRFLDDGHIPIKKRLFLTATPKMRRQRTSRDGDVTFASMDDESVYGRIIDRYSFKQAIKDKVICPARLVVKIVYPEMIGAKPGQAIMTIDGEDVEVPRMLNRVALARAIEETGAQRVITYHGRESEAAKFAGRGAAGVAAYLSAGWRTHAISGKMSMSQRAPILRELRDRKKTLVANCHCLREGVNIPAVDSDNWPPSAAARSISSRSWVVPCAATRARNTATSPCRCCSTCPTRCRPTKP